MSVSDVRLGRNPVRLIGINAPFEPAIQFGRAYGANENPRSAINRVWGAEYLGRKNTSDEHTVKQPLPARQQSILSHQLTPQLQNQLRGGMKPLQNVGRGAYNVRPQLDSVHLGAAISSRHGSQHSVANTISPVVNPNGGLALRRVTGHFNYQM